MKFRIISDLFPVAFAHGDQPTNQLLRACIFRVHVLVCVFVFVCVSGTEDRPQQPGRDPVITRASGPSDVIQLCLATTTR